MPEPATLPDRAEPVDFNAAREEGSESWDRATGEPEHMLPHEESGWWTIELPDGDDDHETFLAAEDGDLSECWGWCDCDGFAFNDQCAHLCQIRKFAVLNESAVPAVEGEQDVDAEVVDMTESDDQDDATLEGHQEDGEVEAVGDGGRDQEDVDGEGLRRDHGDDPQGATVATPVPRASPEPEWWAEKDEVLRRKRDGELFHVLGRFEDVDTGTRKYELHDDTHTTRDYWHAEDLPDCFEKTNVIVRHSRKPIQVLDGRFYDNSSEDTPAGQEGSA